MSARRAEGRRLVEAIQRLPAKTTPDRAAAAVARLSESDYGLLLARDFQFSAPVVRALLARLATERRALTIFLVEAAPSHLDDRHLREAWRTAADALLSLMTPGGWGSSRMKATVRGVAKTPRLLAATQAAVVGGKDAPSSLMAVLAADGSEASVDALLPAFSRASEEQTELLDRMKRIKVHAANNASLDAMFAALERRIDERNSTSPALTFARALGLDAKRFVVRLWLSSVPRACLFELEIDSTEASWFSVRARWLGEPGPSRFGTTSFSDARVNRDQLRLGGSEPLGLPDWLRRSQETLGLIWDTTPTVFRSTLRGRQRDRFLEWLFAQSQPRRERGLSASRTR